MEIFFLTGNMNKFHEAKALIPQLQQLDIDLPEIQEIDDKKIIKVKLLEALSRMKGDMVVEDTSLYFECLKGLPGPLIKWFLRSIGVEGLAKIAHDFGNNWAWAETCVGYARSASDVHFFTGKLRGKIVEPRGEHGFGWDSIFQPDGQQKTFAEMSLEEKNSISMRRVAFEQLKKFLA